MLWPDWKIEKEGPGMLFPFDTDLIQPASIDVTLDTEFFAAQGSGLSIRPYAPSNHIFQKYSMEKGQEFRLDSGAFALASTFERVKLPSNVASRYEGKSSLGRIGLFTHVTAGFIDPGFEGHITLELFNATPAPIYLVPGMRIGQLCFFSMFGEPTNPYGGASVGSHYQGQRGPTISLGYKNFKTKDVYIQKEDQ